MSLSPWHIKTTHLLQPPHLFFLSPNLLFEFRFNGEKAVLVKCIRRCKPVSERERLSVESMCPASSVGLRETWIRHLRMKSFINYAWYQRMTAASSLCTTCRNNNSLSDVSDSDTVLLGLGTVVCGWSWELKIFVRALQAHQNLTTNHMN